MKNSTWWFLAVILFLIFLTIIWGLLGFPSDFQVLQTDVQEDVSFAVGDAMFTYEATVKIKETLPVEVIVEVIEDEGYNEQIVIIDGETIDAEFIGDNRFRHEREVIWNE